MTVQTGDLVFERERDRVPAHWGWFWRDIIMPFTVTRVALAIVGYLAVNTMPMAPTSEVARVVTPHAWIGAWARWDSVWYMRIVRDGYFYIPGKQSSVAFSPLYPMLMRVVGYLTGGNVLGWFEAGILVSNAVFLLALAYLWKLVRLDFDEPVARRTVLYAILAPTAFFFSAAYPMSLILAIAVIAFYRARKGDWWIAAFVVALAPLARPDGIVVVPGLLFEYLRQRQFKWRQALHADAMVLAMLPLATLLGWMLLSHLRFGDALAFVHVQKAWPPTWAYMALKDCDVMIGLMAAIGAAAALAVGWFRLRSSYMVYATMHLGLMISAGRFTSLQRFVLVLFPVYIVLAILGRDGRFDRFWIIFCSSLGSVLFLRFALCYFTG